MRTPIAGRPSLGSVRADMSDSLYAALYVVGIVADLANAQNCGEVCPKQIPLAEYIAEVNRQSIRQAILGWRVG